MNGIHEVVGSTPIGSTIVRYGCMQCSLRLFQVNRKSLHYSLWASSAIGVMPVSLFLGTPGGNAWQQVP